MHGLGLHVDEQVTRNELAQGRKRRDHAVPFAIQYLHHNQVLMLRTALQRITWR